MTNQRKDLGEVLRSRADRAVLTPAGLGEVQRRARRIRRRRTTLAVTGAAASVAVVVGLGVVLVPGDDDRAPVATPSRSSVGRPSVMAERTAQTDLASAPQFQVSLAGGDVEHTTDAEPGVPMWTSNQLQDPTGALTQAGGDVSAFAKVAGRWQGAVQDASTGGWSWQMFPGDGAATEVMPANEPAVGVTPDGASAAWISHRGSASWALTLTGPQAHQWHGIDPRATGVAGILPGGQPVYNVAGGGARIARQDGSTTQVPGAVAVSSVSTATGRLAVQIDSSTVTGCWAVTEAGTTPTASECDFSLGEFSADGTKIVGLPADTGQPGPQELYIADPSTMQVLARFRAPKGGYFDARVGWDGDAVVAGVYAAGKSGFVFLTQDGAQVNRHSVVPAPGQAPAYHFGAGPLTSIH